MSNEETVTGAPQASDADVDSETNDTAPSKQKKDPFERIKAAKDKAQQEADQLRAELKARDEEALAEQGKYKELADQRAIELEAKNKLADQLLAEKSERDAADQETVNQILETIPEENRPAIDGLPVAKQKQLVEQFAKAFSTSAPKPAAGNPIRVQDTAMKSTVEAASVALESGDFSLDDMKTA